MDDRIRKHAELYVDWGARIEEGDDVLIRVSPGAHELAVAVVEEVGKRGATPHTVYRSGELRRAYMRGHDGEFACGDHELAAYENADVCLSLRASRNASGSADVADETRRAYRTARKEIREARREVDSISTTHPTRALAQRAGMAYEEYRDFVYEATLRDWERVAAELGRLKERIDAGEEIRIENERTSLTMSVADRTAVNSCASVAYDSGNLPSGEVYTAPAATEGEIVFDVPMTVNGKRVRDVWFEIADNEVVDFAAGANEAAIAETLETDPGARRIGELGIGMNRGIDRFTDNISFDEKMAETVHLAVGRAYDECLPEGERGNDSAVHQDLIADVSGDSRLLIDGEVVQRNGTFRWEDGFEG